MRRRKAEQQIVLHRRARPAASQSQLELQWYTLVILSLLSMLCIGTLGTLVSTQVKMRQVQDTRYSNQSKHEYSFEVSKKVCLKLHDLIHFLSVG